MSIKREISKWWTNNPQTYGKIHGKTEYNKDDGSILSTEIGTKEFFQNVDKTFYSWNYPLHGKKGYFTHIFPYEEYFNKQVLEIGCGMGTMLMNWAHHGGNVTGVDLNPTSIEQCKKRFELYKLKARIQIEDANNLSFADQEFDYVYSWGVLHHSPDLNKSINEMLRVLKPGGKFGLMLYNRHSILYWYRICYLEGFVHNEKAFTSSLELASRYTDGSREEGNPYTWPITKSELNNILSLYANNIKQKLLGTELDFFFKLILPGLGLIIPRFIKKCWARRFGWSIWTSGTKK